jgi:threonine dehydratase
MPEFLPPTLADLHAAAARIAPYIVRTPVLRAAGLDQLAGGRVYVKAECLQRGGAFKARGAFSAVTRLVNETRPEGVLAFSSGNHAIAVASAAKEFGLKAVLVMPADSPAAKLQRVAALGAEIVRYDRMTQDREAIGADLARTRGYPLVRPFDDPDVIAGQGSVGLEAGEALAALGVTPDVAFICASGGGLCAGAGLALRARFPKLDIVAVEPMGHGDIGRSLALGERVSNAPGVRSFCDALLVDKMGQLPFAMLSALSARGMTMDDASVRRAMLIAAMELKLVLEPSGAIALAAALHGLDGRCALVVASGGNVDPAAYLEALSAAASA